MAGIFNLKVKRHTAKKLYWSLSIGQVKLDLNWYEFVGESDVVFVGVYSDQYASNFDEYPWKTVGLRHNKK